MNLPNTLICLWMALATLLFPSPVLAEGGTVNMVDVGRQGVLELKPQNAQYYLDAGQLTAQEIHNLPLDAWDRIEKKTINIGSQEDAAWFHIRLHNDSGADVKRFLELRWINLRKVDYYQRRASGEWVHHEAGLTVDPFRQYLNSSSYVFPVDLVEDETADLYIRVHTHYNVILPLFVWEPEHYLKSHANQLLVFCVAFGVLAAMMLYNLSLYIFTRDRSYYFYSFYAFAILIYELSMTGIGNRYLWGWSEWLRLNLFAVSVNLSFLCGVLFVRSFLNLKQYGGWLIWLNNINGFYWLFSLLLVLSGSSLLYQAGGAASLFTCVSALITGIYLWHRGNLSARYFTIAWTMLIVFTMFTVMMIEGRLPYNRLTEYGQVAGFVSEMLLLSFALAERINRERRNREVAQKQALDLQIQISAEREDRVHAQEQLLAFQKKTNLELESRVAERTHELQKAMSELERVNSELEKLSVTDPLTQLSNRRYFDEVLARELTRVQRTRHPLGVIMVDIDHFKSINDRYGHLAGDDCLRLVAATLRKLVTRGSDLIARYGGEEFIIILAETSESDAFLVAERIRKEICAMQFIHGGHRIHISASLGVAACDGGQAMRVEELIRAADQALYAAKDSGRNCSVRSSSVA